MDYKFLEKFLGKGFIENLKGELEKVKFAWESRSTKTDQQHEEVMKLVEPIATALSSIDGRLKDIETALNKKDSQ